MSNFMQAVYVTILGMGLVFVSLGALMLVIMALQRLLRERPALAAAPAGVLPPVPFRLDADVPPPAGEPAVSEEVVAAIAVALVAWRARQQTGQPPETTVVTFAPGSPAWRALGRLS